MDNNETVSETTPDTKSTVEKSTVEKSDLDKFIEKQNGNSHFILSNLQKHASKTLHSKKQATKDYQSKLEENDRMNKMDKPHYHAMEKQKIDNEYKETCLSLESNFQFEADQLHNLYNDAADHWATLNYEKARDSVFSLGIDLTRHDLNKILATSKGDYTTQRLALDYAKKHDIVLDTNITVDLEAKSQALQDLINSCLETIKACDGSSTDEIREKDINDQNSAHWLKAREVIKLFDIL